ncbi:MAG TPA: NADH-quinone oxidoreductase subunit L [Verrucomicrobiae bacterium]|nr:NADH-quinone oxidoreductase subunit L [Verrucomicrobiae bacterium]
MSWIAKALALVPLLPLLAALIITFLKPTRRVVATATAVGALFVSFILSCSLLFAAQDVTRHVYNFAWLQMGNASLRLGIALDPLTAVMLVMVTFVGLLIFIFSAGYMADDEGFTRFFAFLSLFAAAMLGVVIANDLLLLFMCWELVGLASYLLIGFWFFKPEAAAAARKAFLTTRIGDVGFFVGMLWLFSASGTLVFYDNGRGCLEAENVAKLTVLMPFAGVSLATVIGLLIFVGAMSKSGQVPLHVWLPDAMEGPTPVSALIHAATMVAAGVFLMARVYPLLEGGPALTVITWVGAITAIFGAMVAVAQNDIKRILAYSTVSQLGYMMMGLGAGGVAVGMFHLITHAFFKALLFLGAGSVIHGCHHEQDIRHMGGLREKMPLTFYTYGIGMLALAGVPIFAGFWSKDEILHATMAWGPSKIPFVLGIIGAGLTAFYMTRQMAYVFFGKYRGHHAAHESPPIMTMPLLILAACAISVGLFGTPFWPWFQTFLTGAHHGQFHWGPFLGLALASTAVVATGVFFGWRVYRNADAAKDPFQTRAPGVFGVLQNKFYFDEIYRDTAVAFYNFAGRSMAIIEEVLWRATVQASGVVLLAVAWFNRLVDEFAVNGGFDRVARGLRKSGMGAGRTQTGQIQSYLRALAVAVAVLVLLFAWGCK